jgi:hypothetical protein
MAIGKGAGLSVNEDIPIRQPSADIVSQSTLVTSRNYFPGCRSKEPAISSNAFLVSGAFAAKVSWLRALEDAAGMAAGLSTQPYGALGAQRCGARTRGGILCQRPAIRGRKRCRLQGR